MNSYVTVNIEDGIAWLEMDDRKVNAMSTDMMTSINQALDAAEEARAVAVLRGREGIFSAGFDMKTFALGAEPGLKMVETGAELILRFLRFPLPIMTVCTGHAYPMGAFLMLAADARWGITGPWKIGLNEVAIAMTLPQFAVETARHRLTPPAFARANTGYLFSPEEAVTAGYLDAAVDEKDLDAAVQTEAVRLRQLDMPSFAATKAKVNEHAIRDIENGLHTELG